MAAGGRLRTGGTWDGRGGDFHVQGQALVFEGEGLHLERRGEEAAQRSCNNNTGSFFHRGEMILEDKPSQQLYRTALLHELWARTNLPSKAPPAFDTIGPAGGCLV